jgi:hypothetical protein
VRLYFKQLHGQGLYFYNIPVRTERSLTIPTVTVGNTYTVTIDGYAASTVAVTGDTASVIIERLADEVNGKLSTIASIRGTTLRYASGVAVSVSSNVTLGSVSTNTYPVLGDVLDALAVMRSDMGQGFLIAPEFFQRWSVANDRKLLATSMEAHCADRKYKWVAYADCSAGVANGTTAGGTVAGALAEVGQLQSPRGHLAYYMPYAIDENDNQVPLSAGVAGLTLRRYQQEGFVEPPAGTEFPLYGVKSFTFDVTDIMQDSLYPAGINPGRQLPNGQGTVIWGVRTVSTSPFYKWVTTRVILNVCTKALENAFKGFVFKTINGYGTVMARAKGTASAILEDVRRAGGLFGQTPDEAYRVTCDMTNNSFNGLESGILNLDADVKPSPVLEFFIVNIRRASLGENFTVDVSAEAPADDIPDGADNSNGNA